MTSSCIGSNGRPKFAYRNRKAAGLAASVTRRRLGEPINAYHCESCHCWHIGHKIGGCTMTYSGESHSDIRPIRSSNGLGPRIPTPHTGNIPQPGWLWRVDRAWLTIRPAAADWFGRILVALFTRRTR